MVLNPLILFVVCRLRRVNADIARRIGLSLGGIPAHPREYHRQKQTERNALRYTRTHGVSVAQCGSPVLLSMFLCS